MGEEYENMNNGLLFKLFGDSNGTGKDSGTEAGGDGGNTPGHEDWED